jgi:ribosome-associated toxin RatA of RatAB toxin-antitoxin module
VPVYQADLKLEQRDGEMVVTARLPRSADLCYRLFSDVERLGEWLTVVGSVAVRRRDEQGRALEVAFTGHLLRASIAYALVYEYRDAEREVLWSVSEGSGGLKRLAGSARFTPEGDEACAIRYALATEMAPQLPRWADSFYGSRPAEAVVMDFGAWVERQP